jgi:hypothetical protein
MGKHTICWNRPHSVCCPVLLPLSVMLACGSRRQCMQTEISSRQQVLVNCDTLICFWNFSTCFISAEFVWSSHVAATNGLLFISQVIYEHGEPWWNDINRENLLIRPPEHSLSIIPAEPSSSKLGGTWQRR